MPVFQAPRGTRDFLPDDMAIRNQVERTVRTVLESFGYQQVQTPTYEQYDLLAAGAGERLREELFTFASDAGRFALRPEMTAPVCRLVASGLLAHFPRPYKLYYFGPCFRYCRPLPGRHREFVQTGVELVGAEGPLADAEVVALAVHVLIALGIEQFTLQIGDAGILRSLLANLEDESDVSRVLSEVDRLARLLARSGELSRQGLLSPEDRDFLEAVAGGLLRLQQEVGYTGPRPLTVGETSPPVEGRDLWVDRLLATAEDTYRTAWTSRGLTSTTADQLLRLARLCGPPEEVFPAARQLLADTPAIPFLEELARVGDWLVALGVSGFTVALGMTRQLAFYTGTVFEIAPMTGAWQQLCGGGRYDRLVEAFGGPPTPATGLAFHFDRLVEAYREAHHLKGRFPDVSPLDILVISPPEYRSQAAAVADGVRSAGRRAGIDLRAGASLPEQIAYFWRLGAPFLVTVGLPGLGEGLVRLQGRAPDTAAFVSERIVPLDALSESIR
jgi:histidyl-tRNA synthetase